MDDSIPKWVEDQMQQRRALAAEMALTAKGKTKRWLMLIANPTAAPPPETSTPTLPTP